MWSVPGRRKISGMTLTKLCYKYRTVKAYPADNVKLKILYENVIRTNKHSEDILGANALPSKIICILENLMRLSL